MSVQVCERTLSVSVRVFSSWTRCLGGTTPLGGGGQGGKGHFPWEPRSSSLSTWSLQLVWGPKMEQESGGLEVPPPPPHWLGV